jgi:competence protein ComFC
VSIVIKGFKKLLIGLELLFPRSCIACSHALEAYESGHYICEQCTLSAPIIHEPVCDHCGLPFCGAAAEETICLTCKQTPFHFNKALGLLKHEGIGKQLIHLIKYSRGFFLKKDLINLIQKNERYKNFLYNAVLVPVPLHSRKERERGFNQTSILASWLKTIDCSVTVEPILRKLKDTPSQTGLNRQKRLENVKTSIVLAPNSKVYPEKRYIILDDVFTTGSTVNACARVLKEKGASCVDVITITRGL